MTMALIQAMLDKLRSGSLPPSCPDQVKPGRHHTFRTYDIKPLHHLQAQRQFIEVLHGENDEVYQSLILAVDEHQGSLTIDDLFPQISSRLEPGDALTLRHHQHGQVLHCTTFVTGIEWAESGPMYTLELPDKVEYQQRRRHPRLALNPQSPVTARLQSPWKTPWFATIRNISVGGMRVTVGGNTLDQLRSGALIPQVQFEFNNHFRVSCKAEVRAFRFIRRPYRHTEISLQFIDLKASDAQAIAALVENSQPQHTPVAA